jgi:hypothetical protein
MLEVLLVSTGLALCQLPVTMDAGVARIENGGQYVMGDGKNCHPPTKLSPDARSLAEEAMKKPTVRDSGQGIDEGTRSRPRVTSGKGSSSVGSEDTCVPMYWGRSLDLQFQSNQDVLKGASSAALIGLLADSPQGITVVGVVPDNGRNKEVLELVHRRMEAIRKESERLSDKRLTFTEQKVVVSGVSHQREAGSIEVIGSFVKSCRAQIAERRSVPSGVVPTSTAGFGDRPGGAPMAP